MDAADQIDGLRHIEIRRGGQIQVDGLLRKVEQRGQQADGIRHTLAQRLIQILVKPQSQQLAARICERSVVNAEKPIGDLAGNDGQRDRRAKRSLQSGQRHFPVALRIMGVTDVEAGAIDLHRQEQRAAFRHVVHVDIPAERVGRDGALPLVGVGRHAHDSQERMQRKGRIVRSIQRLVVELRSVGNNLSESRAVHGNDLAQRAVIALKLGIDHDTTAVTRGDHAVRGAPLKSVDGHHQHVAGLGSLNFDRSGDDVGAVMFAAGLACGNRDGVLQKLVTADAPGTEISDGVGALIRHKPLVADGVDRYPLAGGDGCNRAIRTGRKHAPERVPHAGGHVLAAHVPYLFRSEPLQHRPECP